ncbi:MAG: hypothetical protein LBQ59_02065 [Candidatus Peribacteria bacterium]|nr:hypothetical protein [Candidatus Peribacteria bacterium]
MFDFNEDIYGKEIEIIILEKIRNNSNFQNKKELREQIEKDVKLAKTKKNYVLTF